jgi:hypothetical protein
MRRLNSNPKNGVRDPIGTEKLGRPTVGWLRNNVEIFALGRYCDMSLARAIQIVALVSSVIALVGHLTWAADQPAINTQTYVILELNQPLKRSQRGKLSEAGVIVAEYMGDNRYRAVLSTELSDEELAKRFPFVRAVEPISSTEKLAPEIRSGVYPKHAVQPDGRLRLHIELFDLGSEDSLAMLQRYADDVRFHEQTGAWEIIIEPDKLKSLAREPLVKQIYPAPDPKLL